jgi:hypothetical protein
VLSFIAEKVLRLIGLVDFTKLRKLFTGKEYSLTKEQQDEIWKLLSSGRYIILVWRSAHLSSYFISFGHFLLTLRLWVLSGFKGPRPKFGKYSHALINIEETDTPLDPSDFELVEAISKGVVSTPFDKIFNCDRACLLEPISSGDSHWQPTADKALIKIGTPYDFKFDLGDQTEMSCVEFVLYMISVSNAEDSFKELIEYKEKLKNIDPQVYRDFKGFRVVFEC